jgi:hypothetical protein
MSEEPEDGGQAFPLRHGAWSERGMTLRDYFAAKAMQGFCVDGGPYLEIATSAYKMADEMLKARVK